MTQANLARCIYINGDFSFVEKDEGDVGPGEIRRKKEEKGEK